MEIKASDLSARLLATENLSVIRVCARTASFDIKSRVLTLPLWKEMTPEVEDMLIGHEVGHALYTTEDYIKPIEETPKLMSYMNVIEDVRIEKLIKRKYPGLRKRMNEGYKQLNDRDFFGVKTIQDFDDLLLIDKINLYFKVGFDCGVNFTAEEKLFVTRAEQCETIAEVISLARDIYEFSKQKAKERKQNAEEQDSEESDEEELYDDWDPDFDGEFSDDIDDFATEDSYTSSTSRDLKQDEESSEEHLESKTDRTFKTKLDDLADDATKYVYWNFDHSSFKETIIGYKKILSETKSPAEWNMQGGQYDRGNASTEFDKFKVDTARTVNYLVKEFEMKKSAQLHKRSQISKVGSLDMRKVYAYKLKDDLFKRVTSVPQGKNHGMVMLVDWSGSMDDVLIDTIKQVINLAQFCNRVQIPYRVYAFTSGYVDRDMTSYERHDHYSKYREWLDNKNKKVGNFLDVGSDHFRLLELFSSKMTNSEFNAMSARLVDNRFVWNRGYSTHGTPLNEALAWVYENLGDFIKTNNIEKTTFITLTDGAGGTLQTTSKRVTLNPRGYESDGTPVKQKHFIKEETTQKTYELHASSVYQTDVILRMIKDRYKVSIVGFHICSNNKRRLADAVFDNIPNYAGNAFDLVENWRTDFRRNNFASIKNTARDELFIIPKSSTKIQEGDLEVKTDATAKTIAKNFSKYLNVKKTSRILLNRFVALVA